MTDSDREHLPKTVCAVCENNCYKFLLLKNIVEKVLRSLLKTVIESREYRYLNEYSRCEKDDEIISVQNTSFSQQTEVPKQQAPLNLPVTVGPRINVAESTCPREIEI
ncbi:hypothetical protein YC2023_034621 [Brassica napus]